MVGEHRRGAGATRPANGSLRGASAHLFRGDAPDQPRTAYASTRSSRGHSTVTTRSAGAGSSFSRQIWIQTADRVRPKLGMPEGSERNAPSCNTSCTVATPEGSTRPRTVSEGLIQRVSDRRTTSQGSASAAEAEKLAAMNAVVRRTSPRVPARMRALPSLNEGEARRRRRPRQRVPERALPGCCAAARFRPRITAADRRTEKGVPWRPIRALPGLGCPR